MMFDRFISEYYNLHNINGKKRVSGSSKEDFRYIKLP